MWLLGYEFPSTIVLFTKEKIAILCSSSKGESLPVCNAGAPDTLSAKLLEQLQTSSPVVPIEIYAQAKGKEPPTDAFPKMMKLYTSLGRVGTVTKESPSGKMIDEWNKNVKDAEKKPELDDMSSTVSALMAPKDEEELVSFSLKLYMICLYLHFTFRNAPEPPLT